MGYLCIVRWIFQMVFIGSGLFASECTAPCEDSSGQTPDIKLLILIAASDDLPIYTEDHKIWRAYMNSDPSHIEAYFIKANPNLPVDYEIHGDTIWCRTTDTVLPGVLRKTILSLEALRPKLKKFDYVLRTALSSFYVFPRLLNFLDTLPRTNCYCASLNQIQIGYDEISFGSGSGFILSKDIAKFVLDNKRLLLSYDFLLDDVAFGMLFFKKQIPLIPASRMDFLSIGEWYANRDVLPITEFQFRCKNADPNLRMSDELYIIKSLLKMFYNAEIPTQ